MSNGNKCTGNPDDVEVELETNLSGLTSRARDRNHLLVVVQIVSGIDLNVRADRWHRDRITAAQQNVVLRSEVSQVQVESQLCLFVSFFGSQT